MILCTLKSKCSWQNWNVIQKPVSWFFSQSVEGIFIWMFHICAPAWSWNQILNWNNNPNYIFHLSIPSFPLTLFSIWFDQSTFQGHQMTGSTECFVTGGAEYSVIGGADCFGTGVLSVLWLLTSWLFFLPVAIPIFLSCLGITIAQGSLLLRVVLLFLQWVQVLGELANLFFLGPSSQGLTLC